MRANPRTLFGKCVSTVFQRSPNAPICLVCLILGADSVHAGYARLAQAARGGRVVPIHTAARLGMTSCWNGPVFGETDNGGRFECQPGGAGIVQGRRGARPRPAVARAADSR